MGMAASQARLLSITSRMSDNELRAQIINNSKMRLATDSSKVSEDYVAALNSATMMMSNYDVEGNSQYQKLNFNNLTAYSSQNTQYGLADANGNIFVTEDDADKFRASSNIDEFLAQYGIEYSTTYFDKLTEEDLETTLGSLGDDSYLDIENIKNMYFGYEGHAGYNQILQSAAYSEFVMLSEELQSASTLLNYEISNFISSSFPYKNIESPEELEELLDNTYLDQTKMGDYRARYNELISMSNTLYDVEDVVKGTTQYTYTVDDLFTFQMVPGTPPNYIIQSINEETAVALDPHVNNGILVWPVSSSDSADNKTYTFKLGADGEYKFQTKLSINELTNACQVLYSEIYANISNLIDYNKLTSDRIDSCKSNYDACMNNYIKYIFGEQVLEETYPKISPSGEEDGNYLTLTEYLESENANLCDISWLINFTNNARLVTNNNTLGDTLSTTGEFGMIEDLYVLDLLFSEYGTPNFGWVDTENPSENAEVKAQWYTNLYNRMSSGYRVLEDGLASSNEWIQFALESGLVTMEQIDSSNNWQSIIYSNNSNITEVTDDAAVAKAEAEYNRAMNNIENKDKRYDMELKNIDTEHNSLQTEYDSVKSVIDKNIERSFKIYS